MLTSLVAGFPFAGHFVDAAPGEIHAYFTGGQVSLCNFRAPAVWRALHCMSRIIDDFLTIWMFIPSRVKACLILCSALSPKKGRWCRRRFPLDSFFCRVCVFCSRGAPIKGRRRCTRRISTCLRWLPCCVALMSSTLDSSLLVSTCFTSLRMVAAFCLQGNADSRCKKTSLLASCEEFERRFSFRVDANAEVE